MKVSSKFPINDFNLGDVTTYNSGVLQAMAFRNLKKLTDASLKEHGITTNQWFIIGTVYEAGDSGVRITDLSKQVDTTLSYVTNTTNLLESKGILKRSGHATDSRARMVSIEDEFKPQCAQIESDLRQKMRQEIYKDITPTELLTYIKVLKHFSDITTK